CNVPMCETCGGQGQLCCSGSSPCNTAYLSCQANRCEPCISSVSTGADHACAIKADGTLWCWGLNEWGQLGIGQQIMSNATPTRVVTALGNPFTNVVSVGIGERHTCAVRSDHTLWCWG